MNRRQFLRYAGSALAANSVAYNPRLLAQPGPVPVDLELVLAIDASNSITDEEMDLQMRGYAEAFRSDLVQSAIFGGAIGQIACCAFIWASSNSQRIIVPWTLVHDPASAGDLARQFRRPERFSDFYTGTAAALRYAASLFNPRFEGTRRVIDVSGDGANNEFQDPAPERDRIVADGITINGIAILNPDSAEYAERNNRELLQDYHDNVTGGPGAFVIECWGHEEFADGIRRKLRREIAQGAPSWA